MDALHNQRDQHELDSTPSSTRNQNCKIHVPTQETGIGVSATHLLNAAPHNKSNQMELEIYLVPTTAVVFMHS
jgi:hypothetical protein